jgi:phenylalanyl-tRNA synthetase beta chain
MQISLQWINELVNLEKVDLDELIEKLTLGGFEVEETLEVAINNNKQLILDISATANRSDSLSIQGISAEIALLLNQPRKLPKYLAQSEKWKQTIKDNTKIVSEDEACSIFLGVIVQNLSNTNVPKWITQKLQSCNITPFNNLLDFKNYILLEMGYPFEFYDFDKICNELNTSEFDLSIKKSENGEKFFASNNITYELDNSISTINANDLPLSIAGLIEMKSLSVSETTESILIEASIFNAAKIRQQSRYLSLRTDRSARYEKSLRSTYIIAALHRLISLLRISNPNLACKLYTSKEILENSLEPILLRYERVKEILGPITDSSDETQNYISVETITTYLTRLNFTFLFNESTLNWKVDRLHSRSDDINREVDLIEEIGRLHGFNHFLTALPKIEAIGIEDATYKTRKKITTCLLNLGFNELIHYSLVQQKTFLINKIQLVNPLLTDCSNLRASLLPNLLKTVQENSKQKNTTMEGFEYGHVFYLDSAGSEFKEKEYVAGVFGGLKTKLDWTGSETGLNWFEAKGKIEQLFDQLNLKVDWIKCSSQLTQRILHPYRSTDIYSRDQMNLGVFGQIHPILANQLNLSTEIYLFEFNVETINSQLQTNGLTLYKPYSLYPRIIKDLSFIVQRDISFKEIKEAIHVNGTEFLSEINLLDEYRGQPIPENQTSLCLQLIFQSEKKTLENKEIENIIKNLQTILIQKFQATLRE